MIIDLPTNHSAKGSPIVERMRDEKAITKPSAWATRSEPGRLTSTGDKGYLVRGVREDVGNQHVMDVALPASAPSCAPSSTYPAEHKAQSPAFGNELCR